MIHKVTNRLGKNISLLREGKVRKLLYFLYIDLIRLPFRFLPHDGVRIVEEEWDCLIVLDACRDNLELVMGKIKKTD